MRAIARKLDTTTILIFSIAFVVCGVAWMRFFWVTASNPSPVRYVEYADAQGTLDPFVQDCAPGPSFIEDDAIWRFCSYADAEDDPSAQLQEVSTQNGVRPPEQWGLVRFDLEAGEASLLWPLDVAADSQILALARAESGDLAVAWGSASDQMTAVYRIDPAGGAERLEGLPEDLTGRVSGLAWSARGLELVIGETDPLVVLVHDGSAWHDPEPVIGPADCGPETLCKLQMAHLDADVWYYLFTSAPVQVDDPAATEVQILRGPSGGPFDVVDSLILADLGGDQYTLSDEGQLLRIGDLFDRAPGNVINWSLSAEPFLLHGGTWEQVVSPENNASFYFSNYEVSTGSLRWIPGLNSSSQLRAWQIDQWLTLKSSGDGIVVLELDGETGETLTTDDSFLENAGAQTSILPASNGGYWLLGPNGAYVRVSESLERADQLNILERVKRAYENFGRFETYQDGNYYREQKALKMAAFPLVLLSLPAGYVLVFFVAQARRNKRAWVPLLARISAIYLVVATVFMWWFWELMDRF
ncbi:MAG: hypothetical protein GYB65_21355 [Chloroflexi bacterium]|nr:hypothetical protein [Chloroflexota bacterium]